MITSLFQSLAQQMDIIGCTAAAPGLHDQKRCPVHIVFPALQRIQKLSDHQQCRITGIIVDIPESQLLDLRVFCMQKFDFVTLVEKYIFHDLKMNRKHIGNQDGVILFHFFCKNDSSVFCSLDLSHGFFFLILLCFCPDIVPMLPAGCEAVPSRLPDW